MGYFQEGYFLNMQIILLKIFQFYEKMMIWEKNIFQWLVMILVTGCIDGTFFRWWFFSWLHVLLFMFVSMTSVMT